MKTGQRRTAFSYIPGYSNNAVIQLIIASGVAYVILALIWAVIRTVYPDDHFFYFYFVPNIGLLDFATFKSHAWTLLTYGWFLHPGKFWELFSNMLWLYCFGNVVQMLVGYKQVIPLYIYSLALGGLLFILGQLIPGLGTIPGNYLLGPSAGVVALATASVTISPKYRFYFTEYFSLPLAVIVAVYIVLMIIGTGFYLPSILLLTGGSAAGFLYIKLLQAGFRPGAWMYSFTGKIEGAFTPKESKEWKTTGSKRNVIINFQPDQKHSVSQKRIDDILDKINQKGYDSISDEEKEILKRASDL